MSLVVVKKCPVKCCVEGRKNTVNIQDDMCES